MSETATDRDNKLAHGAVQNLLNDKLKITFMLLASLPIWGVLLPWDFGPRTGVYSVQMDIYRWILANNSLAVPVIQLAILMFFLKNRVSLLSVISSYKIADKIAVALFVTVIAYAYFAVSIYKLGALLGILSIYIHLNFSYNIFTVIRDAGASYLKYFWVVAALSTIAYSALWAIDYSIFTPGEKDWVRRVPGVTNVRWTGFFWLTAYCAGLVFAARGKVLTNWPALVLGSFGLGMTIWTGTRGALLAMMCATAGAFLFSPTFRKFIFKYAALTAVIAVGVNLVVPVPHSQYGIERIFAYASSAEKQQKLDSGRLHNWQEALKLVKTQPVAGHGIDQYQAMGPADKLGIKGPHSFPVQILFSIGLLGAACLIYGVYRFFSSFKMQITQPHHLAALAFFCGGSLYQLYDNFLYYPYPITMFMLSIFMIFNQKRKNEGDQI